MRVMMMLKADRNTEAGTPPTRKIAGFCIIQAKSWDELQRMAGKAAAINQAD